MTRTSVKAPRFGSSRKIYIIGALVLFLGLILGFTLDFRITSPADIFTILSKSRTDLPNMSTDHAPKHDGHDHDHYSAHAYAHVQAHDHATASIAHSNGEDFTESNRAHWDKNARSYTSEPWQKDIVTRVTTLLQDNVGWLGLPAVSSTAGAQKPRSPPVRVLDYACGPGTVTGALGAHADEFVGLDLSDGMVAVYNERFHAADAIDDEVAASDQADQGFTAKALQANLISSNSATKEKIAARFCGPQYQNFDLVAVGLGFHHFEDLPHATRTLAARLKPGGTLAIVDLMRHEMEDGGDEQKDFRRIVAHAGFGFETVKRLFEEEGGLVDVEWKVMEGEILIRGKNPRRVFIARGRKPEVVGDGGGEEKL